jgi:AraC-like DNA-binding protein
MVVLVRIDVLYNLYTHIATDSNRSGSFTVGDSLMTILNCGLKHKYEDLWSHFSYVVYVLEGHKIWYTAHGSYDLREGSCVFVTKGACIVEQFFDAGFCFFLFFVSDEFITEVLKGKSRPVATAGKNYDPVIAIDNNSTVQIYVQSMMAHFEGKREPDRSLLELKFRELILMLADNPVNASLLSYFNSLLQTPRAVSMQKIMENNFSFNLGLKEFAKLSARSLSAFKRDFQKYFDTTPGKWLTEKRLNYAMYLLSNAGKTVSEAAFESGFENPSHFSRSFRLYFGVPPTSVKHRMIA